MDEYSRHTMGDYIVWFFCRIIEGLVLALLIPCFLIVDIVKTGVWTAFKQGGWKYLLLGAVLTVLFRLWFP